MDGRGRGAHSRRLGAYGDELQGRALVAVLQGRNPPLQQQRKRRPGVLHHRERPEDPGRASFRSRSDAIRAVAVVPVLRAPLPPHQAQEGAGPGGGLRQRGGRREDARSRGDPSRRDRPGHRELRPFAAPEHAVRAPQRQRGRQRRPRLHFQHRREVRSHRDVGAGLPPPTPTARRGRSWLRAACSASISARLVLGWANGPTGA